MHAWTCHRHRACPCSRHRIDLGLPDRTGTPRAKRIISAKLARHMSITHTSHFAEYNADFLSTLSSRQILETTCLSLVHRDLPSVLFQVSAKMTSLRMLKATCLAPGRLSFSRVLPSGSFKSHMRHVTAAVSIRPVKCLFCARVPHK